MRGLYMKKSLAAFFALTSMLGFSAYAEDIAFDAVFYVSSARGNDANDGSSECPVATIGKAVSKAVAGKTKVWIEDGTYQVSTRIDLMTAGKEVYIEGSSHDPTKVVVNGTCRMFHNDGPYCEIRNLTLTSSGVDIENRAILIKNGRVSNCIFTGLKNSVGSPAVFMTRNAILENCLFYGNSGMEGWGQVFCSDDKGTATGSPAVVNCTFYDDSGCGGVSMAWANGRVVNCVEMTGGVLATGEGSPTAACYQNCAGDFDRPGATNWLRVGVDPFVDSAANVFSVYNDSLLADAGDTSLYREVAVSATDLANNPRFSASDTMNIGAYEWPTAEKLAAHVRGGNFVEDGNAHSCLLFFGYPRDGNGCQVEWAWSDDDGFSHMKPAAIIEPGVYTNIARVTLAGYEPYYGTGVVTIVSAPNHLYVSPGGDDKASGTNIKPLKTISAAVSKAEELFGNNPSYSSAEIRLSEGTYAVGSTISISSKRIDIIGLGDDPTKVVVNGTCRMFHNDGPYCEIRNLTLTSSGVDIKSRAILIKNGRVSNCIFTGLKNSVDAPAVFMTRNAILENCLFYGNSGMEGYGQVFCTDDKGTETGSPAVVNCTFYDDSGCGGVSMAWANGRVINCVEMTGGVLATGGGSPTAACYQNCAGDFDRPGATNWIKLEDDPFVDAANGDFRIGNKGEALMYAGDLSLYSQYAKSPIDLAGIPRSSSKGICIGAYEGERSDEIAVVVTGGVFCPDGLNHPCRLNFIAPVDGIGCTVSWAWTDSGPFEHAEPSENRAVGTYTNVVRITKEACDPVCATAVVEIVECLKIYVATNGNSSARGTRDDPFRTPNDAFDAAAEFLRPAPENIRAQVFVGDGEYVVREVLQPEKPVDIIGLSGDPTKVVLRSSGNEIFRSAYAYCECKYLTLSSVDSRAALLRVGRFSNCIFTGCRTKVDKGVGGVLYLTENGIVENCLFYGNQQIDGQGFGQIYCLGKGVSAGTPVVANCTIYDENGIGGISMSWENGRVINCLEITGGVVANCGTDPVASCYQNCAGDFARDGATRWIETTAAAALPNLSKAKDRWRPGAPLINKGNKELYFEHATSTTDLFGCPRKIGSTIDIGCCEYSAKGLVIFLSSVGSLMK